MKKIVCYCFLLLTLSIPTVGISHDTGVIDADYNGYTILNLADKGLSKSVFNLAVKGFKELNSIGKITNTTILTIVDYSQSSNQKRLYVIDLKQMKLLFNSYVAHGRNTGDEFATTFSNNEGSLQSCLGFFVTDTPVIGSHTGFSLVINGVEKGINDNAAKRSIIFHAAEYVSEEFIKKNGRLGRSYGCPALPPELNKPIIETIKGGTCLFMYYPDNNYLCHSALLK